MAPVSDRVQRIVNDIVTLIDEDAQIKHCRVNVVNGCSDVFVKYKHNLAEIEDKDHISVRFYKSIGQLHEDLFHMEDFMADDWFNLFVFNVNYCKHLCINEECQYFNTLTMTCDQPMYCIDAVSVDGKTTVRERLLEEIRGIDLITYELRSKFDSKFYASTIVSMLPAKVIHQSFEEITGEECPIKSLRYFDFDFDGEEILTYMFKILQTHSTEFLTKWSRALDKLEDFTKSASALL
jgi:hypothetical protein